MTTASKEAAASIRPPRDGLPLSAIRLAYLTSLFEGPPHRSPVSIRRLVAEADRREVIHDWIVVGVFTALIVIGIGAAAVSSIAP